MNTFNRGDGSRPPGVRSVTSNAVGRRAGSSSTNSPLASKCSTINKRQLGDATTRQQGIDQGRTLADLESGRRDDFDGLPVYLEFKWPVASIAGHAKRDDLMHVQIIRLSGRWGVAQILGESRIAAGVVAGGGEKQGRSRPVDRSVLHSQDPLQ